MSTKERGMPALFCFSALFSIDIIHQIVILPHPIPQSIQSNGRRCSRVICSVVVLPQNTGMQQAISGKAFVFVIL
jgi:hypothetical protein